MDRDKLFRELTDATATDLYLDGWEEFGERVLIGKNEINNDYLMAMSFFQAATELRKIVLDNHCLHLFRYEYPMFFLYRHALEVFIKSLLPKPPKHHNLEGLLFDLIEHIKHTYRVDISDGWFTRKIGEFSKVDPSAQSFRYTTYLSGDSTLSGDYFVNLKVWGDTMDQIGMVFLNLHVIQEAQKKDSGA